MIWVNIFAALILILSFVGGLKEGAVKNVFSLIGLLIAIPVAGALYRLMATALSFLQGTNWENFIGFFITMALITLVSFLVFLIPRRLIQKLWSKGVFFRVIGGTLNLFNAAIGFVVFALLLEAYPIFGWLEQVVNDSSIISWLVVNLGFVKAMLPFI